MAKFKPGEGGRKKGSLNKDKSILSAFIDSNIDQNIDRFQVELDKLKGKEFIKVFVQMAKIMRHDNNYLTANKKLIELFDKKTKSFEL